MPNYSKPGCKSFKASLIKASYLAAVGMVFCGGLHASAQPSPPAHAPRVFPDTRDRIRVFADQLPTQLTPAQQQFVATHYVGSQKQTQTWVRAIRRLNPNYLLLHYQLGVGAGTSEFLDGDRWTNDFAEVTKHENWFVHDEKGKRVLQPTWKWYVMDARVNGGKPHTGFPAYWLQTAIQRMRDCEADGCFADSYTQDILMNQVTPQTALFHDVNACKTDWLPGLNEFGAFCTAGFHKQPEKFVFLPNLGGLVTTWDTVTNIAVGDGGMNEGFCAGGPGNYYSDDDWKLQMNRLLLLASRNKIVLCQTNTDPSASDHRWFIVGSYLLTKGRHSYLNMFQKTTLEWYPEYDLDLGAYKEEPKPDLQAYWKPEWNVYAREYEKGLVVVNPSSKSITIADVGRTCSLMSAHGGGEVGADGKTTAALEVAGNRSAKGPYLRSVQVPSHSARALMFSSTANAD